MSTAVVDRARWRPRAPLLVVGVVFALLLFGRGAAWAQTVGITVDPAALGALTEAAGAARSATFTVVLDAAPGGDVTVTLTHGADVTVDTDPGAAGNQATLTFTTVNWSTAQTVTVEAVDDSFDEVEWEDFSIALSASGGGYDSETALVTGTVTDDDTGVLEVTTASDRKMYPAFDADTNHYAVGCETDDPQTTGTVTVTLAPLPSSLRVSVNGVQVANRGGEVELSGLDGYSDIDIMLSNSTGAGSTYTVHCLPETFPKIVTNKQPQAWGALLTISTWYSGTQSGYIAIIDNNGVPRFHRRVASGDMRVSQFRTHDRGKYPFSYAVQHGVLGDDRNWEQVVLDDGLNEVERVRTVGLQHTDNHDFVIRDNGNYVLLAHEPKERDFTGYVTGDGDPWGATANVIDSVIQERTQAGAVVHQVNSWDILDLADCKRGTGGFISPDWAHVNSLQVVGGDYIASYGHCNQVLRINAATGKVVWRLGISSKSDADWTAGGGQAPLEIVGDPYGEFCGQHSARMIAHNRLLLFDNGGSTCNGDRPAQRFSRVVEYALDLAKGEATFVRHHFLGGAPNQYARAQGTVELMPNGHWLISWGAGLDTAVTEVVPGPRNSQTQGTQLLSVKIAQGDASIPTRSYPVAPGTLRRPSPGPLTEESAVSTYNSTAHTGVSDTVSAVVAFNRPVVDFAKTTPSVSVTGATVASVAPHIVGGEAAHAYLFELTPTGSGPVGFGLVAGQSCASGGICTRDGAVLSTVQARRSVPWLGFAVSGLADASVAENTAYGPVAPSVTPAPAGSASWSLEGSDADDFTIATGTGALSMAAQNFEAPADADRDNVYEVTVRATDTAGRTGAQSLEVTVADVDEPPEPPTALGVTAAAVALEVSWTAPSSAAMAGKPAVGGYDVEYGLRTAAGASPAWGAWVDAGHSGTAASITIGGLTAGATYRVRVRATSPEGAGGWLGPESGTPTAPPRFASASATRRVAENTAPASALGAPLSATDDDGDTLKYALASSGDHAHFGIDAATGQLRTSGALDYETKNSYSVTVQVRDSRNASGTADTAWDDTVTVAVNVSDVDEPPGRPSAPTVSAASAGSLNVRWSAPANTGPPITDYDHRYKRTSGSGWTEVTGASASTALAAVIASLDSATSYDVQVRATNPEGTSGWSPSATASTGPDTAGTNSGAVTTPPPSQGAETAPVTGGAGGEEVAEFTDIGGSVHEDNINRIAGAGITLGCNPPASDRFCPQRAVTRAQMASFLARALRLPAATRDHFSDDDRSVHEDNINRIARAGITLGCNPPASDRFCPQRAVTRAQMASFLARALRLPAATRDHFSDDDRSVHEDNINRIARAGITLGCNPPASDRFCPQRAVTRAQMASFLARALTLPDSAP